MSKSITPASSPGTTTDPDLQRYNEACTRYDRFIANHVEFQLFEEVTEELNAATDALERKVRAGTLTHPDFTPKKAYVRVNKEALIRLLTEPVAKELGVVKVEQSLELDEERLAQLIDSDFFTQEEQDAFATLVTPYNKPPKVTLR